MLDEIFPLQITAKLGGNIVSLEIEITSSMRCTESTTVFFHFPLGFFTFTGIDTRENGRTAFSVSSKRHRQSGVNEIVQVSKWQQVVLNPGSLNQKPDALLHNHHAP